MRRVAYHGPCFLRLTKSSFWGFHTRIGSAARLEKKHLRSRGRLALVDSVESCHTRVRREILGLAGGFALSSRAVSYQYWELLTRVATGPAAEITWLCRELVRQSEIERLFCVVRRAATLVVTAVDCDGYPLGYADQRLRDSEFGELALSADGGSSAGVQVTRKVSRASKRTAVLGSLALEPGWVVTLVLENRFSGAELATIDDQSIEQWVVLVALAVRLGSLVDASAQPASRDTGTASAPGASRGPASSVVPTSANGAASWPDTDEEEEVSEIVDISLSPAHEAERSETLRALDAEHWNISRAARTLGMTRHGLKKRMRRLQVARPN